MSKTLKDVVAERDPEAITNYCYGGVFKCPSNYFSGIIDLCSIKDDYPDICTDCWNREYEEVKE